jgi:protein disulfide-isomerase
MKTLFIILFTLLFTKELRAQHTELIWYTDLDEATEISSKSNKPLMLFFTGSDWCYWCKKLEAEVFVTEDFKIWSQENVVLVLIDFPRDKKNQSISLQNQNKRLSKEYQIESLPTIWFVKVVNAYGSHVSECPSPKLWEFSRLGQSAYIEGGPSAWIEAQDYITNSPIEVQELPSE